MVWLDGKPTLVKTLVWPADDPDLKWLGDRGSEGWSVLDDQIVFWKALPLSENPRTVVYMTNITSTRETQSDTIALERVFELDYAAHSLVIVRDVGFATAEWRSDSGVCFRAHSGTGEFLRERHCPAQASYRGLSVLGTTVSLCVTSTDPIPPNWDKSFPATRRYRRLDYEPGYTRNLPLNLIAETIAIWNVDSGDLRMVKIPQLFLKRVQHEADFDYISPHKIALAGRLAHSCGAVLCAFSTNEEDKEPLMFYQGEHTDPDSILNCLGRPSTSTLSPIVVHSHDTGGRITVFKNELLLGDIHSVATTRDPSGMRETFNYPNDARTLDFRVSYYFPCVAATRVLVYQTDFESEPAVFVLDFDQTLLASLLSKQPSERADWNAQLIDVCAQVKVVTRRFDCDVGGEIWDQEYPWPQRAPPEWEAHLDTILRKDGDEDEDMDNSDSDDEVLPSGLEYDEAPEEHREPVPFGYVQTALRLGGVTDAERLAITQHAILELPKLGGIGRIFYFD